MTREEAHRILSNGLVNAPSEHEWCMAFEMAIKALGNHDTFMKYAYSQGKKDALSQEPCDDAVSRDAVIEICNEEWDSDLLVERIEHLPSVTQKSVLDKIRAEIRKKMAFNSFNEGYVLYDDITKVFDKYKAESEGK